MRFTLLLLLLIIGISMAKGPRGGYVTFEEMYTNTPSLLDTTFYLVPLKNDVLKRTKLFHLRYVNARGYDRPWSSESKLWGYTDGVIRYYFDNGVCTPLRSWNQQYAWFYMLVVRTSSGPNGITYLERAMVYDNQAHKAYELTFKKLEELLEQTPSLLQEYQDMRKRDRKIPYFINRFITLTQQEHAPTPQDSLPEDTLEGAVYF